MVGPKRQKIHFPNAKAENESIIPRAKRSSKNLDATSEPMTIEEMREVVSTWK